MDGFFVAKFKVEKRGKRAAAAESAEADAATEEADGSFAAFDDEADKSLMEGESVKQRVFANSREQTKTFTQIQGRQSGSKEYYGSTSQDHNRLQRSNEVTKRQKNDGKASCQVIMYYMQIVYHMHLLFRSDEFAPPFVKYIVLSGVNA